jgi:L-alanine-DL-glutamate epimerase-like enolase superfamily enzyme
MAIRRTETWMLRFPSNRAAAERVDEFFELIGVTLHDESGEQGTGWTFTSDYGGGESVKALLDHLLVRRVVGRSTQDIDAINVDLFNVTHRLGHGIASLAIAAVDIALWDLRARLQDVPLARALGQVRDRVPAYGSGKASPTLPLDELVQLSAGYVGDGFRAIKLRIGRNPGEDFERVRQVREAVGPEVRILCDANERLDLPTALWLGRRLADLDIFWLEEPLLSQDLEAYRRLRAALPIPLALGEHVYSRREFVPYIAAEAIDVVQPDACMIGGLSEAMKIGRVAESFGLALAPHFMTELHVHLAAALPRATYVEYYPFMDDLLQHHLEVEDGHVLVPSRCGHGVAFTPEAWKRYRVA